MLRFVLFFSLTRKRDDVIVCVDDLITIKVENGFVSEAGARLNISVALQYLNSWLQVRQ